MLRLMDATPDAALCRGVFFWEAYAPLLSNVRCFISTASHFCSHLFEKHRGTAMFRICVNEL